MRFELKYIKIISVYVLLAFGGLWNALGMFSEIMKIAAGPLMILLTTLIIIEIFQTNKLFLKVKALDKNTYANRNKGWWYYIAIVIMGSFVLEMAGHETGVIFGEYKYGDVLLPQLFSVPVAIGFAWLSTLLGSLALLQRLKGVNIYSFNIFWRSVSVGFIMMMFDLLLEPAAMKLSYWHWYLDLVPVQNYLAWFIFGTIFAYIGFVFRVFEQRLPDFAFHAFIAQMIYFGISLI